MFGNAVNGTVEIDGTSMDYISFGNGEKPLIMLPGLSDGLKTVHGMGALFAMSYRAYAEDFRVYVFSGRNKMPEHCTSRDMAEDRISAMDRLGISKADILGVSQGGTIAQYIAIDHSERVNRLVLAVTFSKQNSVVQDTVRRWIGFAEAGDYESLIKDTAEMSYSEEYLKKYRKAYPIISRLGKPRTFDRFLPLANAVLEHDSFDELGKISCPVLIIGGKEDKIVTPEASCEMAEAIKGSKLYMYDGLGHGAYEEAKDFNKRVIEFLQ